MRPNPVSYTHLDVYKRQHEDHALSVQLVKEAAQKLGRHIAIFQDLQGPKIRLGQLNGEFLEVAAGETLVLTTAELVGGVHDGVKKIAIDHPSLHEDCLLYTSRCV